MRKSLLKIVTTSILFACMAAFVHGQTVWYANSSADPGGDGSARNPFNTLTDVYNASDNGDTIYLTGTFTTSTETGQSTSYGYFINKELTIIGSDNSETVIQAAPVKETASAGVLDIRQEVHLKNLTIKNGYTSGYGPAGVNFMSAYTTMYFENINFIDNINSNRNGGPGAIKATYNTASIVVNNCYFTGNRGGKAGCIEPSTSGTYTITNSTFYNNSSDIYGAGAIYCNTNSRIIITNCTFSENEGGYSHSQIGLPGSGIQFYLKNSIIANSVNSIEDLTTTGSVQVNDGGNNIIETFAGSYDWSANGTNITGEQTNLFGTGVSTRMPEVNDNPHQTPTIALSAGSVALDAADLTPHGPLGFEVTPGSDQRGAAVNSTKDIGAFEYWADLSYWRLNGDGTPTDPYEIEELNDLAYIIQHTEFWNGNFVLMSDLNAYETMYWDDLDDDGDGYAFNDSADNIVDGNNEGYQPMGLISLNKFEGNFDGQGYTILGLTTNRPATDRGGLFGWAENATIQNVRVMDCDIYGKSDNGAIVATATYTTIDNCHSSGEIHGAYGVAGGIVGRMYNSSIVSDCSSSASIIADDSYAGGLAGYILNDASVSSSFASGDILTNNVAGAFAGSVNGSVNNCYATGDVVRMTGSTGTNFGGFSGLNSTSNQITNSYSTSSVYSADGVDWNEGGNSDKGFSGNVSGVYENNFFDSELSNQSSAIGATAKGTEAMKTYYTYDGLWEFPNTWRIDESESTPDNNGYPSLAWQGLAHHLRPYVVTDSVNVAGTDMTAYGDIKILGKTNPSDHGICWNTVGSPTIADEIKSLGGVSSTGTFNTSVSGLTAATTYYVRTWATNSIGTRYGEVVSITAQKSDQTITFESLEPVELDAEDFELTASSDQGLTITYTSSDPTVASISGSTVSVHSIGTTTITASQSGNGSVNPAEDVEQVLEVTNYAEITATACDSYQLGSSTLTSTGSYMEVFTNVAGTDSVVYLELTVNESTTGTDEVTACDTYTWIDGVTYTESNNTATWVLTNAAGCDSIVTLDLTITNSTSGTDEVTACDTYTWIDGVAYTESNNTATHVLTNAAGCDSIVTLDLTINQSTTAEIDVEIGDGEEYTAPDDQVYVETGTYTAVINNTAGCDSTITINLVNTTGVEEDILSESVTYYPNPASDFLHVEFDAPVSGRLEIFDIVGNRVFISELNHESESLIRTSSYRNGIYMVKVSNETEQHVFRIIKQ